MPRVEGVDVINQLLPFVDPHVCREQTPDKDIEIMKGGRCEGFHLRNVYRDRAPSISTLVHPEVPQCEFYGLLNNDCGQNFPLVTLFLDVTP